MGGRCPPWSRAQGIHTQRAIFTPHTHTSAQNPLFIFTPTPSLNVLHTSHPRPKHWPPHTQHPLGVNALSPWSHPDITRLPKSSSPRGWEASKPSNSVEPDVSHTSTGRIRMSTTGLRFVLPPPKLLFLLLPWFSAHTRPRSPAAARCESKTSVLGAYEIRYKLLSLSEMFSSGPRSPFTGKQN